MCGSIALEASGQATRGSFRSPKCNRQRLPSSAQESFAPAQFFDLTDEEKLTSASFKNFDSGIRVGDAERLHTGYAAAREVKYELKYIDSQRDQRLSGPARLV